MKLILPKLYAITDARLSTLSHAEQLARLADGGAMLIQLREKWASPREFYREAQAAVRVARARGVKLIINDRADIALACGADGVHLGQDDLPPAAARRLLGDRFIIGYSTHDLAQIEEASRLSVDYVAFGPVFPTRSKEKADAVVGLSLLSLARAALDPSIPLVGIGGITRENARAALDAGANSVAVISALVSDSSEIARRTREFLNEFGCVS
ncbi:MAG: thiamine-phosphate pyrophosphorylase [Acidobacteriota bacterium]|nr:thiamine-phosphate pyrophosphorylase [Acidobacteriota bacterium]